MEIVIEGEAAAFVAGLVEAGRFASPRDAVEATLRQAAAEDARKLEWLRAAVREADKGGDVTLEELDRDLEELFQQLEKEYP